MRAILIALAAICASAAPAAAEVTAQSETSFTVVITVPVETITSHAYRAFVELPRWWDPAHTYTGEAAALDFDPSVGGCWCERFPDGDGVEHMRVIYTVPGGGPIRMRGGLGPLQAMGAHGIMTVEFETAPEGSSTKATLTYVVTGPAGTGGMAGPVNAVLGQAMARFAAYAAESAPAVP
jgi:hypothetical protein